MPRLIRYSVHTARTLHATVVSTIRQPLSRKRVCKLLIAIRVPSARRCTRLGEPVALAFALECRRINAEQPGAGLRRSHARQHTGDVFALDLLQGVIPPELRRAAGARGRGADGARQPEVRHLDPITWGEDDGPLDGIAQLAQVARPGGGVPGPLTGRRQRPRPPALAGAGN